MKEAYDKIIEFKEKISKIEELVLDSNKKNESKVVSINQMKIMEKKNLIYQYIKMFDKTDIFDLGMEMRSIGVIKFFDIMKIELSVADENNKIITDFNLEENEKIILQLENEIEISRDLFKNHFKINEDYPFSVSKILKEIINLGLVKSQEDVIDFKLNKRFSLLNIFKSYKTKKLIKEYYQIKNAFNLFSNGDNLYEEYNLFINNEKNIEKIMSDIQNAKSKLQSILTEIEMYKEDFDKMNSEYNIDKIKANVIDKFLKYIERENMFNYYLEIFENKVMNKDMLKRSVQIDVYHKASMYYLTHFKQNNDYLMNFIKEEKEFLKTIFHGQFVELNEDDSLMKNFSFFTLTLRDLYDKEREIINFLTNKENIKTENLEEIEESVRIQLKKSGFSSLVYIDDMYLKFNEVELEKYNQEKQHFVEKLKENKTV